MWLIATILASPFIWDGQGTPLHKARFELRPIQDEGANHVFQAE